jgi:hypothetical protein
MSEKPEEEFDDDEETVAEGDGDEQNLDRLIDDFDTRKKAGPKPGEPAWRRLERRREERETAALLSDIDDYDIGDGEDGPGKRRRRVQS